MFADPQVEHVGMAQPVDGRNDLRLVGQAVSLSRTPSRLAAAPPELGQHTDEVLQEFGIGKQEIAALRDAKLI
jgi:crotonobetainyl-CoA:carnitine CoA-transferase CaiB-like acyl-CoA transferase